jgi:integron integrase
MKSIPTELLRRFREVLPKRGVTQYERGYYEKWLRYYLDFCAKYHHRDRDRDSLDHFMQKLSEKNQSERQQEQAAKSIAVYYDLTQGIAASRHREPKDSAQTGSWDGVYIKLKEEIKLRQYSSRTLSTYRGWIERFERFVDKPPSSIEMSDVKKYLTYLAVERKVAASTQNQAFNALLFLFRHVFHKEFDARDGIIRARRKRYIPVVLTREEVDLIISHTRYPYTLIISLLYGCGLRLFECLNLRVQCFNFDAGILTIHDGKGKKDRTVPLPQTLLRELQKHLEHVNNLYKRDIADGFDGVFLPGGLERKYKNAAKEYIWQWFFPAKTLTFVPENGEHRRYHLHETHVQKAIKRAVNRARIGKRATAHTFRHSFASHLLQANYDIRTIQQMLGHSDVRTTMIYTHTVESRTLKEQVSPLDFAASSSSVSSDKE